MLNVSLHLRPFIACPSCSKTIGQVPKSHVLAHMFLWRNNHENTLECGYNADQYDVMTNITLV